MAATQALARENIFHPSAPKLATYSAYVEADSFSLGLRKNGEDRRMRASTFCCVPCKINCPASLGARTEEGDEVNVVLKVAEQQSTQPSAAEIPLMSRFSSRESHEIVIAFAGPIGCGIKSVINSTSRSLKRIGYNRVEVVKISTFLDSLIEEDPSLKIAQETGWSDQFYRYRRLQEAGKEVRSRSHNKHILAEYAVERIVLLRAKGYEGGNEQGIDQPQLQTERVAYLIDQVKRPEEVELLRALYRNLFYLVGVTKPHAQRVRLLEDEGVYESETRRLMEIDRSEAGDHGQKLEKTLHLADFFVRNDVNMDQRNSIERFAHLIHGDKSQTPDRIELGMYAAYAAGLRSACLSRQVGASVASSTGDILSTGCNDVPAPGGGLYTSRSGKPDFRCVHKAEKRCFNDFYKRELQNEIGEAISATLKKQIDEEPPIELSDKRKEAILAAVYNETRLGSLIEFSRSVHAEMDAITSLARAGGPSLLNATLYTTTFPCHSCARHIVAAGIHEVYYIEPYEKSMAQQLHDDSIVFEFPPPQPAGQEEPIDSAASEGKVRFLHFEGVAPRLFAELFRADGRKDKASGQFIPMNDSKARKVLPEYLDNYRDFEKAAVQHLQADKLRVSSSH